MKFLFALTLIGLLCVSTGLSSASAQSTDWADRVLNKPAASITNGDITQFVDLIVTEQVTVLQTESFMKRLSPTQNQVFTQALSSRVGVDLQALRQENEQLAQITNPTVIEDPITDSPGALWRETVENAWTSQGLNPFAVAWYEEPLCDLKGDGGTDFVFVFAQSANPLDTLRWTTTSPRVYATFIAAYGGGNLIGFGFTFDEVRLCIGDGGVNAAGGAQHVADSVFVSHP
jgi:hypothetical protein